jgi:acyl carrier protein
MNLLDSVVNIVAAQFHVSPKKISQGTRFVQDLGADSLDLIELVIAFEEKFSIQLTEDEAEKLDTVGKVVACIGNKVNGKKYVSGGSQSKRIYISKFGEIYQQ